MSNKSNTYLPGLSIVRAIAAYSVLFGHMYKFADWGTIPENRCPLPEIYLPVTTFFVISGFLITWGLLHEQDRNYSVNIGAAYKKRAIRILPLYYIGIVIGLLYLWLTKKTTIGNIPLFICLLPNVAQAMNAGIYPLWHYWTIGTEVIFYLWFPWVVKYGRRHLLKLVFIIGGAWFALKLGTYVFVGKSFAYRFICLTQFHTIMLGAIAAILFYEHRTWLINICSRKWFAFISWCLFLSTQLYVPLLPSIIQAEVIALISTMLILSGFCGHALFENQISQFFGRISYAIYIFHPIIIAIGATICEKMKIVANNAQEGAIEVFFVCTATTLIAWLADRFINIGK